jgi:AcrR family transcriptional regulator
MEKTIRYGMEMDQEQRQLTADDWARAALHAFGEGGLSAVAVQPLATKLGVTKGSFYWHFANREALISAALALWERITTDDTIALLDGEPDPVERLRALFTRVSFSAGRYTVENGVRSASDNEVVAAVLRRVERRRLDYTIGLFEQIGFSPAEAVRRGVLSYTAYVGHSELAARLPGLLPLEGSGDLSRYVETVIELLLDGRPQN